MKPTTLARNGVSTEMVDLISRLVDLIPWSERRCAMGDITLSLLDGKHRVAENVFGWNRSTVAVGINEFQTGISCVNDISTRLFLLWWEERKHELLGLKNLLINLGNGPECNGHRSQFLHRMTEFADITGLCVRLVYYPPYRSKYNGIERYWAGLEKSWNGYLLSTVDTVLKRAVNFFWKGVRTVVRLLDKPYAKGVKVVCLGISSTESKSRINFLSCLGQGSGSLYVLNAGAFTYMEQQKLPPALLARLEDKTVSIETQSGWEAWLDKHGINALRHRKIITEGALMGGLLVQGIPVNLSIVSDDAGQFNVFRPAAVLDSC